MIPKRVFSSKEIIQEKKKKIPMLCRIAAHGCAFVIAFVNTRIPHTGLQYFTWIEDSLRM